VLGKPGADKIRQWRIRAGEIGLVAMAFEDQKSLSERIGLHLSSQARFSNTRLTRKQSYSATPATRGIHKLAERLYMWRAANKHRADNHVIVPHQIAIP
jgi:hypothetical protein